MTASASTVPAVEARGFNRWVVRGFVVLLGVYLLYMSAFSPFNHDELEAVHTAWKILHGELIYVDFFQHHHPLFYLYLAPVIALGGDRAATVLACRIAILPLFLGIVATTCWLAGRLFDGATALVAAACLLLSWPFLFEATQIRPDVPQVLFGMLALVAIYPPIGGQSSDPHRIPLRRYLLSGVCLGISLLFLQKAIFYIAALVLIVVGKIYRQEAGWKALFTLWAGIAAAILPFSLWLAAEGMVREYFFLNWTLNAHCLDQVSIVPTAIAIMDTQPAIFAFAVIGLIGLAIDRRHGQLAMVAAVLFSLVVAAPARYLYYWIPVLPLLAIYAAHGLMRCLRRRPVILAAILAGSAIAPVIVQMTYPAERTNQRQLAQIAYVLETAAPSDSVYDGDIRFNVFRKDLDYFWFSLDDRQMLQTYQSLRPYEFDVYDRIDKIKPKVISTFHVDNLDDSRIRVHYVPSPWQPTPLTATLLIRARQEKGSPSH
jgi:hypothetical protein